MSYSATTRDRYRLMVTAVTGSLAAAAMVATGWMVGAAAHGQAQADAQRQAEQDAARARADRAQARYEARVARQQSATQPSGTVLREHPTRTRVTTRYVAGAAPGVAVGGGGSVSSTWGSAGTPGSSGGSSGGFAAPQSAPVPLPPPPPAPSSGS